MLKFRAVIAELIRMELKRRDWDQQDLARAIGKAPTTVGRWLKGESDISVDALDLLSQGLGYSPEYIVRRAGEYRAASNTLGAAILLDPKELLAPVGPLVRSTAGVRPDDEPTSY